MTRKARVVKLDDGTEQTIPETLALTDRTPVGDHVRLHHRLARVFRAFLIKTLLPEFRRCGFS